AGSGNLHGRLTMARSNGTDVRYEQYDALGRVTAHTQVTDTVSYPFSYQYNLADKVTLLHYPSGREVVTTYNGAGRPEGVTGYASSIAYAPFGGMTSLALGNGVTESTVYDSRLRMSSIEAGERTAALLAQTFSRIWVLIVIELRQHYGRLSLRSMHAKRRGLNLGYH
ncbi:MAG: hypothetical protein LLG20_04785, partial [Acidobacteriales bacterium]|nr:hypothetical protein [Terriglobales bacterium]